VSQPVAPLPAGSDDDLVVDERVTIPREELEVRASRSGGAGGQHVNKSSTRIELLWNVARSRALDEPTREHLLRRLASRLDGEGTLRLVASDMRSQLQNRRRAEERLVETVRKALVVPKPRKATKPSRAAKQARLDEKRRNAERKRNRRTGLDD
jgi:ribosome-associated protein